MLRVKRKLVFGEDLLRLSCEHYPGYSSLDRKDAGGGHKIVKQCRPGRAKSK